jgi:hypothetical protein
MLINNLVGLASIMSIFSGFATAAPILGRREGLYGVAHGISGMETILRTLYYPLIERRIYHPPPETNGY